MNALEMFVASLWGVAAWLCVELLRVWLERLLRDSIPRD